MDNTTYMLLIYCILISGHGKLVMKDGSFYEGEFVDGDISGSGVRKWTTTGNLYEGDFLRGELNGKGTMTYSDGSVYEGEWCENMRQGIGSITYVQMVFT